MSRAVLSLGSNLGDRAARLRGALEALSPWLVAVSDVVETAPWGPVAQDDFLNLVAVVDDPGAGPGDWLARGAACEAAAERTRGAGQVRWGPRTLDVDVLTVSEGGAEVRSDDPHLTLPHPRLAERAFVLVPWAQVDPAATVGGTPVTALRDALGDAERTGVTARPDLDVRPPEVRLPEARLPEVRLPEVPTPGADRA